MDSPSSPLRDARPADIEQLLRLWGSLFDEVAPLLGPWKTIDDLEIAVAEHIDWYNHRRLHGQIGLVPPVDHETTYYAQNPAPATVEASEPSLH